MAFLQQNRTRRFDRLFAMILLHGVRRGLLVAALAGLALMMGLHAALYSGAGGLGWTPAFAIYAFGVLAVDWLAARHYPHDVFGWSNTVTLLRGALACVLITPLVAGAPDGWAMVAIATAALSLDGADGWLARRHGLVSSFGARFDIEVDAALALILAVHALSDGLAGPVVLILGLAYYLFIAATWIFPWLGKPLPERFSRKAVCVLQLGTLIALQVPFLTASSAFALALAASLALLASFAVDTAWLWRHRR